MPTLKVAQAQLDSWRQHPVTKALFQELQELIQRETDFLVEGRTLDPVTPLNTHSRTASTVEAIKTLRSIEDLSWVEVTAEEVEQ